MGSGFIELVGPFLYPLIAKASSVVVIACVFLAICRVPFKRRMFSFEIFIAWLGVVSVTNIAVTVIDIFCRIWGINF